VILLFGVFILLGFVWSFLASREPRYQGKSLSDWYKDYCRPLRGREAYVDGKRRAEALAAIRQIGTNALPYLLDIAFDTNKDSSTHSNLMVFASDVRTFFGGTELVKPELLRREASPLIRELKPPARALLPLLQEKLHSTNFVTNSFSLYLFGGVGEGAQEVLPYLAAPLKARRWAAISVALESIEHLGPTARGSVPALVDFLADLKGTNYVEGIFARVPAITSNNLSKAAATLRDRWLYSTAGALANMGTNAAPAVPLLQEFFETRTNINTRAEIAFALCRIDPTQTNALDYLVTSLQHRTNAWYSATRQLGELGPQARVAEPVLLEALGDTNESVVAEAAVSLKKIGVPAAEFVPQLKAGLNSKDQMKRFRAAQRVMSVAPADADAHRVLVLGATEAASPVRYLAVEELGKAGPAAKDAIPALRELLKSNDRALASAAAEALKEIEAKAPDN
jgi:HEAT repeat protein